MITATDLRFCATTPWVGVDILEMALYMVKEQVEFDPPLIKQNNSRSKIKSISRYKLQFLPKLENCVDRENKGYSRDLVQQKNKN